MSRINSTGMWTVCVFTLWCSCILAEPLMGTIVMTSVMNIFMNTDSFVLRAHQLKQFICYHTYLEDILRKVIQDLLNFDTFSNIVHYTKKSPCIKSFYLVLKRAINPPIPFVLWRSAKLSLVLSNLKAAKLRTEIRLTFDLWNLAPAPSPLQMPHRFHLFYPNCHLHCIPAGSASFRTKVQFVLHGPLKVIVPRLGDLPCAKGSQGSFSPFVPVWVCSAQG